ncbi:hypothetical protein SAMN05216388_105513 [Halorientalis persicus]|uniref:Uncharacterized protein n=1 Tax=Halorientalis persicus TaxID=1367881 RepID=A0A1H8WCY3_9EURY|nr:hypothetical protein SAMN05216388_105513 [Halorientalis persicus]
MHSQLTYGLLVASTGLFACCIVLVAGGVA